jgi:hypothetical protein
MLQTQRCGGSAGLALGYYIFAAMRLMSRRVPLIEAVAEPQIWFNLVL